MKDKCWWWIPIHKKDVIDKIVSIRKRGQMSTTYSETSFQFLLAEYNSLRKEIENTTAQMRQLVTYSLLASGCFWAWHTSRASSSTLILKFVPFALTLLFFLYNFSLSKDMKRTGDYLSAVEKSLKLPFDLGWESHIRKLGWNGFSDYWDYIFWSTILLGNFLGAFLL